MRRATRTRLIVAIVVLVAIALIAQFAGGSLMRFVGHLHGR